VSTELANKKDSEFPMKTIAAILIASTAVMLTIGCAAETEGDEVLTQEAEQRIKPVCPVPEPVRQGAPATARPSAAAKIAAYKAALSTHDAAVKSIAGKSCESDAQCDTGNPAYQGICNRYVWTGTNGSCILSGDPAPAPRFTCADFSCPVKFQCEVEVSTNAVGCVEPRTCTPAGAKGGGGGGGRNR
jgi:hypothetical protein